MKKQRILIVEDERLIAENHKERLIDFGYPDCDIAHTKEEAKAFLVHHEYDLVLLDVRLNERFEGIELGNFISEKYKIPFIYLTAHSDIESVKKMVASKPISYLSKPIRKSDLFGAISIVFAAMPNPIASKYVRIKDGGSYLRFEKQSLLIAESSGNYVQLKFNKNDKSKLIRMTLENLLSELNDESFIRVSRFCVVNIAFISEIKKKYVVVNDEKINISPKKYDELIGLL